MVQKDASGQMEKNETFTNVKELDGFVQKGNSWQWTDARIPMVTPPCNKDDVCCITRHNMTADQVVSLTHLRKGIL